MRSVYSILIIAAILFFIQFYFFKKVFSSADYLTYRLDQKEKKNILFVFIPFLNLFPLSGVIYLIFYSGPQPAQIFPFENNFYRVFILFPFWVSIVYMVQVIILFIVIDIVRLITFPIYRKNKLKARNIISYLQIGIAFIFIFYVPIRVYYDYLIVTTSKIEFQKEKLPNGLDNFKIALIADLQMDVNTNEMRLTNFIEHLNSEEPDLVLIAGDIITSTPRFIKKSAKYISKIKSKHGIYSCIGDHDNWAYRNKYEKSRKEITDALLSYSIKMIDNNSITLDIDKAQIKITFVTNTYVVKINESTLDSLTNGNDKSDLKIFLTHQPRNLLIDYAKKNNYDLYLAGHTHGGQLTFLFPFINLSPTLVETIYVKGAFWFDKMLAVVNGGLGMSLAPLRYNSTPEITIITLRAEN